MRVRCPRCRTVVEVRSGASAACPECGFEFEAPSRARPAADEFLPVTPEEAAHHARPPRPPRHRPVINRERIAYGLALNIFVPGAGTLYTERKAEGWGQLVLFLLGLATIPFLIGLAFAPAAWVWALVSSIQHLVEFDRRRAPKRH